LAQVVTFFEKIKNKCESFFRCENEDFFFTAKKVRIFHKRMDSENMLQDIKVGKNVIWDTTFPMAFILEQIRTITNKPLIDISPHSIHDLVSCLFLENITNDEQLLNLIRKGITRQYLLGTNYLLLISDAQDLNTIHWKFLNFFLQDERFQVVIVKDSSRNMFDCPLV
jgi:hypothetical protein